MSSDRNAHEMRIRTDGKIACSCDSKKVFLDDRAALDHAEWAEDTSTLCVSGALDRRLAQVKR